MAQGGRNPFLNQVVSVHMADVAVTHSKRQSQSLLKSGRFGLGRNLPETETRIIWGRNPFLNQVVSVKLERLKNRGTKVAIPS